MFAAYIHQLENRKSKYEIRNLMHFPRFLFAVLLAVSWEDWWTYDGISGKLFRFSGSAAPV